MTCKITDLAKDEFARKNHNALLQKQSPGGVVSKGFS